MSAMHWREIIGRCLLALCACLPAACATGRGPVGEGTLVVGEVQRVLTREQVAGGDLAPDEQRPQLAEGVRQLGLSDADVDAGRAIAVRRGLYWFNSASGVRHGIVQLMRVEPGLQVEAGNVVEVRVDADGHGAVQRVRAANLVDGGCRYVDLPSSLLEDLVGFVGMVGARGISTLYCEGLEREGWQRPQQFWIRKPGAPPAVTDAGAPSAVTVPPPAAPIQPPPPAGKDLAQLLLMRTDEGFGSPFDVPFWVDGQKVAGLSRGHCETVLVHPGEHSVAAGAGNAVTGVKRELGITVRAGDRVVVEYIIDNSSQTQWGLAELFSAHKREQMLQRAYVFVDRPARPDDRCAIRHAPAVVGRPTD